MSPSHLNLDKARRVSFTLGAAIAVSFFLAGAGVTWGTMRSDLKTVSNTTEDHERRLRTIEKETADRLGRIESKIDDLRRRSP